MSRRFWTHFRSLFRAKRESPPCLFYERIRSIRYQKGKRNVIKRQKISFLGLLVLLTGLWNLQDIQNSLQNRSKNKLVRENAVTRANGSCSLRVIGSWSEYIRDFYAPEPATGIKDQLTTEKSLFMKAYNYYFVSLERY